MEQEIQPGLLPVVTNPLHCYIPHVFNEFQFPLPTKSFGVMKVVVREVEMPHLVRQCLEVSPGRVSDSSSLFMHLPGGSSL